MNCWLRTLWANMWTPPRRLPTERCSSAVTSTCGVSGPAASRVEGRRVRHDPQGTWRTRPAAPSDGLQLSCGKKEGRVRHFAPVPATPGDTPTGALMLVHDSFLDLPTPTGPMRTYVY